MKILLDTHIFLWFISADSRLPTNVREAICNVDNEAPTWGLNRMARRNGSYADGRRQRGISVKN